MNQSRDIAAEPSIILAPLQLYFEAFAEHDSVLRGELLARCLTADAEIWGPKRVFAGYAAISDKIAAFHQNWLGCRLVLASGIYTFGNVARFGVAILGADGSVRVSGEAVNEFAPDGRIRRVIPFWEPLPLLPNSWPQHLASPGQRETLHAA